MTDTTQQSEVERIMASIMAASMIKGEGLVFSYGRVQRGIEEALATLRPKVSEVDLEKASFRSLCEAAGQSNWIPPEYMANDWLADCARFLRTCKGIVQASGAEVWEVMPDLARQRIADAKRIAELEAMLRNPPKHNHWGPGEPDCPRDLKAGNGELHTLRCKVCGDEDDINGICFGDSQ